MEKFKNIPKNWIFISIGERFYLLKFSRNEKIIKMVKHTCISIIQCQRQSRKSFYTVDLALKELKIGLFSLHMFIIYY